MKIATVFLLLLYVPLLISARHIPSSEYSRQDEEQAGRGLLSDTKMMKRLRGETVEEVAGSRLPDCSHACGSCSPCRLVMVSFVCASLQEAETCPMAYKCMCHDKSYPVP
ncbi:protein EPIDERMAL PATTERNING FACTOR 1 [Neltuma alba]|uniref:protein EPIDERMAL PATTERNING FACTOR 1 n=1 Tax=Neltuma alba TaxID=207710 RepID=UPI0010A54A9C|nr:protein EPIDERMAL PATTERNING FACTOR 1 [Prosopis alba]